MSRIALIIKGYSKSATELKSDKLYIKLYSKFLYSIAGGAWEEEEVILLSEPTFLKLENLIEKLKPEYALVIFIGHGAMQNGSQLFQLNKETVIKAGQFTLSIKKQLIILESCRTTTENIPCADLEDKIPTYKYGGYIRGHINRNDAKKLFFTQLNKCVDGIVICFACSQNQAALNYYFSYFLLNKAFEVHLDTLYEYRTFGIIELINVISKNIKDAAFINYGVEQVPEIIGNINFPFSVSKFDLLPWEKDSE